MAQDRWINIEIAKKLLKNVCDFLEIDDSGIADFKIVNGKEAVLMSLYTRAFFIFNEKYRFKFRSIADAFHAREPLTLLPTQKEVWSSSEIVPLFAHPLSSYFKFFPNLNSPKYLFMVDGSKYLSSRGYFYPERIVEDMVNKIKEFDLNPTNCLVWYSNGDSTYGEDFWEYISGIVLRNKGYFVTFYTLGGGDLYAYYIPDYIERLIRRLLLNKGAFIEELEMLGLFNTMPSKIALTKAKFESVVIEAQGGEKETKMGGESNYYSKYGCSQIEHYLSDYNAHYTHGYIAGPFTEREDIIKRFDNKIGLISCDEDGNLIFVEPEAYREPSEEKAEIIRNVLKCSLLRNLTFEERCKLIGIQPTNLKDYFEKILSLDIDIILDKISEKLEEKNV